MASSTSYSYNKALVSPVTSRPLTTPASRVWFVDGTNGADANAGDQDSPFLTVTAAITATSATRGDVIIVAPGTYTTAAIVPKANTTIMAGRYVNPRKPSVILQAAVDVLEVDVDGCNFVGLEFKATAAAVTQLVDVADAAAVAGIAFEGCVFNGADQTTVVGVNAADATFAMTEMYMRDCLFRDLTGTGLAIGVLGMAYSQVIYNQFALDVNSGTGISLADTTAFATGKAYEIGWNTFTGFDSTADEVGITISGTENTTGAGIIHDNRFAYLASAAITIDKLSLSEVQNYYGDVTTGGVLVDPGS